MIRSAPGCTATCWFHNFTWSSSHWAVDQTPLFTQLVHLDSQPLPQIPQCALKEMCGNELWKFLMGNLCALAFHLACSCPEALLQPTRDRVGKITLSGREAHGGCVYPVRARASRFICQWPGPVWYKLSHRWIYHLSPELRAYKLHAGLHFFF